MKTYQQINDRIESGKAVVLTADEIMDYVDEKGLEAAAEEVDVVTTATMGPMCSSGCFLNFGHSKPKIRMSEAWIEDVLVYTGIAAVDVAGARVGDPFDGLGLCAHVSNRSARRFTFCKESDPGSGGARNHR